MSLLARLIEAGTPAELIEEVAMLLAEKRVLDQRRANERDRKRSQRENECHVTSRESTGQDGTGGDNPTLSRPPNENNSNPPTHTHPERKTRARETAHLLPEEWQPKAFGLGTKSRGIVDGWPPGEQETQLEHFRAHHRKKGDRFIDWQAAWSTWVLNNRNFANGRSRLQPANGIAGIRGNRPNPALDMVLAAEREIAAEAERENQGFDWPSGLALPSH